MILDINNPDYDPEAIYYLFKEHIQKEYTATGGMIQLGHLELWLAIDQHLEDIEIASTHGKDLLKIWELQKLITLNQVCDWDPDHNWYTLS